MAVKEEENLFLVWINEKQLAGDRMFEAIICGKVRHLHCDKGNTPGPVLRTLKPVTGGFTHSKIELAYTMQ